MVANCHTTNSRDELTKALKDHYSKPRELATKMLDAINKVCNMQEVHVNQLFTPERVANFLKTSNKAKRVLSEMINEPSMNWVSYWLNNIAWPAPNTPWPAPPAPVLIQNTVRHDDQPQSSLKQKQKTSVSRENGFKSSFIHLVCHPEKQDKEEEQTKREEQAQEKKDTKWIDQSVQRSVTCHDVSTLKTPKRRLDETSGQRGIPNFIQGRRRKAARLTSPGKKQKNSLQMQMQMPEFIHYDGPPLASQPVPVKDPVGPNFHWVSKKWKQTLAEAAVLIPKRCLLNTVDRLRNGRKTIERGSLIVIPTMASQRYSDYFSAFRLTPEPEHLLIEDRPLQYLVRAESELVEMASRVIDCDE
ncbi:MAG: hypothetical protein Q9195_007835 [Heterodermia aff. obscurata]